MRLIDAFMPLIGYLVRMRENVVAMQPSYQQVRGDVRRLLSDSESCARTWKVPPEEYELGRFMVCAWADEALLASEWREKGQWQREQLQRVYFNTTDAGVEVFDKLNALGVGQKDVREVYFVCLSLGFRGRFINPGDEILLEQLRFSNLKLLPPVPDLLFPEGFPPAGSQAALAPKPFSFPLLAALAGPVLLFAVLHLIYRFTLGSVADRLF